MNEDVLKIITLEKNEASYFKEHCRKMDDISLVVIYFCFSLKQTQLLNLTQYLLTYWIVFPTVYLHFYLLFFTFILRILKFIQYLYVFFIKTSKVLMGFKVFLVRFTSSKCSYVLFSMKRSYLLTWNCCQRRKKLLTS